MSEKNIIFNDKKINKSNFYKNKKLFKINEIDVNKILVSKRKPYGKKAHLNTFLDMMIMIALGIRPLCIKLSQMIGCVK